jgi:hypothetical protein
MAISDSARIRVERVTTRKVLKAFVGLPAPLYRDDPAWVVPLMFERLKLLAKDKNPYFEHAAADYWIAYRDGDPVGRISAQIDELTQDGHREGTGHFGFVEAPDDPAVFGALFETAEAWLQDRGMVRVLGPFNLSINEECGLLIDGFKDRPRIMMNHARPYYAARIEELGYRKAKDLWAYDLDAVAELPENVLRIVRKAEALHRLQVRPFRRRRMSDDFQIMRDIFNDAWSNNWGYLPFTAAEINKMRADLSPLLCAHSGKIAYWDGEPAAFMLVVPDLNELIADLHGRLAPIGWGKLAWRVLRRRFPCVRVPLMGVRRKHQNRPSGALMALLLIEQHRVEWRRRHGMVRGELSWILEDNESMKGIADSIGAVHYKTYRIYEKALR